MAEHSTIEWCDSTFNPWIGCTKIAGKNGAPSACDNCYAESQNAHRKWVSEWGPKGERRRTKTWGDPLKWQRQAKAFFAEHGRRRRVFSDSLCDIFDNQAPQEWRDDLWELIYECPDVDFLVLTKRPQNMAKMLPDGEWGEGWPNVWLGVTAENQEEADRRIPILLNTPAAIRFVSYEPALGPVDFTEITAPTFTVDALSGRYWNAWDGGEEPAGTGNKLDQIIFGGESGSRARLAQSSWARLTRDQCEATGVAFFLKQWGEWLPVDSGHPDLAGPGLGQFDRFPVNDPANVTHVRVGKKRAGRLLDGVEHNGFPERKAA